MRLKCLILGCNHQLDWNAAATGTPYVCRSCRHVTHSVADAIYLDDRMVRVVAWAMATASSAVIVALVFKLHGIY